MHWRAAQRARLRGGRALTTGWDYQARLGSLRVDRGATRFRLFSPSRIWGARRELQRQRFADLCSLRALGTSPRLGQCGHVPAGARRWFTCGCGTIFEPNPTIVDTGGSRGAVIDSWPSPNSSPAVTVGVS